MNPCFFRGERGQPDDSVYKNLRQSLFREKNLETIYDAVEPLPLKIWEFLSNHSFHKINLGRVNQQDLIKSFIKLENGHKESQLIRRE